VFIETVIVVNDDVAVVLDYCRRF